MGKKGDVIHMISWNIYCVISIHCVCVCVSVRDTDSQIVIMWLRSYVLVIC